MTNPTLEFEHELARLCHGDSLSVQKSEAEWHFHIGSNLIVSGFSLWRLVGHDRLLVTGNDDGQQFGLLEPVSGEREFNKLVSGAEICGVTLSEVTGDLAFLLSNGLTLEILTFSSGYESWSISKDGEFFAAGASGGLV